MKSYKHVLTNEKLRIKLKEATGKNEDIECGLGNFLFRDIGHM